MPTITVYRHGVSSGMGNSSAVRPNRTAVIGWSSHAIRRNLHFLYSVDESRLIGLDGLALTLTVRDCPSSAADWCRVRDNWFRQLRRVGPLCVHWVTEWQRRGVPHLHLAIYWPSGGPSHVVALVRHWLNETQQWRSTLSGQHWHGIYDVLGWSKYVSKHAARGLRHYQRSSENLPDAWRGASTGRMWGKLGDWPITPPMPFEAGSRAFHRLRRFVRSWRCADARRSADGRRIRSARSMLRCPIPSLSPVRGVSEWLPASAMLRFLRTLDVLSV